MQLVNDDCLEVMRNMPSESVDAIVTDPPYGLNFMGKHWDYDVPSVETWRECLRVLKPGGHLLSFAGTRTQHRMAVNIEDAGFEIRDMIAWVYGSGFPKSLNVSKAIDKVAPRAGMFDGFASHLSSQLKASGKTQKEVASLFPSKTGRITGCVWNWINGASVPTLEQWTVLQPLLGLSLEWLPLIERIETEREVVGKKTSGIANKEQKERHTIGASKSVVVDITAPATESARQWQGWGTALKPALEPITVARKPLIGTVAENVLTHGTGALNIDGCRVETDKIRHIGGQSFDAVHTPKKDAPVVYTGGRWPANLIHDGSEEVLAGFPQTTSGSRNGKRSSNSGGIGTFHENERDTGRYFNGDKGSAARFFYCAKASKKDRGDANNHPTVKPTDLMRYLCRLVTPPGGTILDPFMGSGSTGKAATLEGFDFIGIERDKDYYEIASTRIKDAQ